MLSGIFLVWLTFLSNAVLHIPCSIDASRLPYEQYVDF